MEAVFEGQHSTAYKIDQCKGLAKVVPALKIHLTGNAKSIKLLPTGKNII